MPKTYLITGSSRGIGLELVRQLAARGDTILAAARNPAQSADLQSLIRANPRIRAVTVDVSDDRSIAALGESLAHEKIDVLINNAGVSSSSKTLSLLDPEETRKVFMVNALAPMLVVKALLPALRAGNEKTIVQITSVLASIAQNTGGSSYGYRASKAALNQFNKCLANELAPEKFCCVAIHPGWVRTDMGGPNAHLSVEDSARHIIATADRLTPGDNGRYLNYDGTTIPW